MARRLNISPSATSMRPTDALPAPSVRMVAVSRSRSSTFTVIVLKTMAPAITIQNDTMTPAITL